MNSCKYSFYSDVHASIYFISTDEKGLCDIYVEFDVD